ncbi:hypothetical protein D9M70_461780 [compost metagenome]
MIQGPTEQASIAVGDTRWLAGMAMAAPRSQQVGRHQRRQQACHRQREQHGDRDRQAELLEVLPDGAADEADRRKDRDDRQGRGDDGKTDRIGRVDRRDERAFAHVDVAFDILDLDDRVVDENADDERQRQQADAVEREAEQVHHREGRQDGERHGKCRNQRRSPVAQEGEDNDDRQDRTFDQGGDSRVVAFLRVFDERDQLREFDAGHTCADLLQPRGNGVGNDGVTRSLAARNREADDRLAVDAREVARLGRRILDRRYVGELHPAAT